MLSTTRDDLRMMWDALEARGATVNRVAFDPHASNDSRLYPLAAAARERLRVLDAVAARRWSARNHPTNPEWIPPWNSTSPPASPPSKYTPATT